MVTWYNMFNEDLQVLLYVIHVIITLEDLHKYMLGYVSVFFPKALLKFP